MRIARRCRSLSVTRGLARRPPALLLALGALGCGDKGVGPAPGTTSVQVTSVVDSILAVGRTAQLAATARDQSGNPILGAQFTWSTSNSAAVGVSGAGVATAQGSGTATITATSGSISGNIRLRAVPADLVTVTALAGDPLAGALVAGLSAAREQAVQTALGGCGTSAGTGNVVAIKSCADVVRAEATSAADPTDRALLAVLALYADQIERLLGL